MAEYYFDKTINKYILIMTFTPFGIKAPKKKRIGEFETEKEALAGQKVIHKLLSLGGSLILQGKPRFPPNVE